LLLNFHSRLISSSCRPSHSDNAMPISKPMTWPDSTVDSKAYYLREMWRRSDDRRWTSTVIILEVTSV